MINSIRSSLNNPKAFDKWMNEECIALDRYSPAILYEPPSLFGKYKILTRLRLGAQLLSNVTDITGLPQTVPSDNEKPKRCRMILPLYTRIASDSQKSIHSNQKDK